MTKHKSYPHNTTSDVTTQKKSTSFCCSYPGLDCQLLLPAPWVPSRDHTKTQSPDPFSALDDLSDARAWSEAAAEKTVYGELVGPFAVRLGLRGLGFSSLRLRGSLGFSGFALPPAGFRNPGTYTFVFERVLYKVKFGSASETSGIAQGIGIWGGDSTGLNGLGLREFRTQNASFRSQRLPAPAGCPQRLGVGGRRGRQRAPFLHRPRSLRPLNSKTLHPATP